MDGQYNRYAIPDNKYYDNVWIFFLLTVARYLERTSIDYEYQTSGNVKRRKDVRSNLKDYLTAGFNDSYAMHP